MNLPADFPCQRLTYEDIVKPEFEWGTLQSWLGLRLAPERAVAVDVGSTRTGQRPISALERRVIRHEGGAGMRLAGYLHGTHRQDAAHVGGPLAVNSHWCNSSHSS